MEVMIVTFSVIVGLGVWGMLSSAADTSKGDTVSQAAADALMQEQVKQQTQITWIYGVSESGAMLFRSQVKGDIRQTAIGIEWTDFEGQVQRWNGKFMTSTKPLDLNTPLMEVQQVFENETKGE
jgi:hypothetical protein